jgi:outer membrane protein OmpA-like peptidoglycan-associated protein
LRRWPLAALLLVLAACGSTPRRDLEFDRLHASLQALGSDPALARLALAERALAQAAVRRLDASSINAEEHAHLAYLAERRVDIAYIAAQTEAESARLAELERERAELLLAASRRETAAVREELDRQRQRELLAQEDRQRSVASPPPPLPAAPATTSVPAPALPAAAEPPASASVALPSPAAQVSIAPASAPPPEFSAAPPSAATLTQRLAELAPDADGQQITLEDLAFEPGTAQLVAEAAAGVARIAAFVGREPARAIRIEGHTDATGSPDANRLFSLRRAESLRDALIAAGVAAPRIAVSGEGSAQPVASNDEAEGRARNRRVVVRLLPP